MRLHWNPSWPVRLVQRTLSSIHGHTRSTAMVTVVLVAAPVLAQETSDSGQTKPGNALEEITVTARKREESMQQVPVTVSALTGVTMERVGIKTMDQVSEKIPSLYFSSMGGGLSHPQISMRGNASRSAVQNDVAVGFYTDGIYTTAYNQLQHGPVDAQRVEVLSGPQGTVFGRNTIAGAVNIITNDPTDAFEGKMGGGWGRGAEWDENIWHTDVMLSGPLTETLSARAVYSHKERDGYLYDPVNNQRYGSLDSDYARVKLLWQPTDVLDVRVTGEYAKIDRPRMDVLASVPQGTHSLSTWSVDRFFLAGINGSAYEARTDIEGIFSTADMKRVYLQADLRTAAGTVTSLTSYGTSNFSQLNDPDGTDCACVFQTVAYDAAVWSQELRLAGASGRLDWLAGLYYLKDDIKRNENFAYFRPESPQYVGGTAAQFPWTSTETDSYAVFAQGGYRITDKLKVTAGARWSYDKKVSPLTSSVLQTSGATTSSFRIVRDKGWESTTGLLSVSYDWRDDIMTYVSYSTGFKAGGFQSTTNAIVSAQPFDPEEVAQIEVGLKSTWFDRRLRANIAAYTLDYSDLQVNNQRLIDNRAFSLIGNAAGADVRGVDVDLLALVMDDLTLGVNYSWIPTAKIKGFSSIAGFPSIEGFRIPRTPENSYTLSAEYSPEALQGSLTLGADYVYRDEFVNELDATVNFDGTHPVLPSAGYALVNLRGDYVFGAWTLSGYVRNALNKEYFPSSVGNGGPNRYYVRAVGAPRTWEISLERKF